MISSQFFIAFIKMPPFDWQAALFVGSILTLAAGAILVLAIATPFIAIQAGGTLLEAACAIGLISVATGLVGGLAAGFYWGNVGEIKRREQLEKVVIFSSQLDIYFDPSPNDPKQAAKFRCNLVSYEPTDLATSPTVTEKRTSISATNADEFYQQVGREFKKWFAKSLAEDKGNTQRRVTVYMVPFPGDGVYERLKQLAGQSGPCIVNRSERPWESPSPVDKTE